MLNRKPRSAAGSAKNGRCRGHLAPQLLVLIDEIAILPALYRRVMIPPAVLAELSHVDAPALVRTWAAAVPEWIDAIAGHVVTEDPALAELDAGESAAISLALANRGALLLMDDLRGRAEAARRKISTIGTLGILRDAASIGLVDLATAFRALRQTTFRCPSQLMDELVDREARRTRPSP